MMLMTILSEFSPTLNLHCLPGVQVRAGKRKGSLQNELRKNTAVRSPKGFPNRGVCVRINL